MAVTDRLTASGGARIRRSGDQPAGAGPAAHRSARPGAGSTAAPGRPDDVNIYSHTFAGMLTKVTRRARYLVYAPDSRGLGVYVINPKTYRVIRYIGTGQMVQHVVPAWNLRTLYATNDLGDSLTPINPDTGKRAGRNIPVADPYNMYFTPDGRHAIVVEEAQQTLAFRDPQTFALQKALPVHCGGVDHMDFTADGRYALASCEFSGQMVRIDLRTETVDGYVDIGGSPQDVKLSPDGRIFYVANRYLPQRGSSGVQLIDARRCGWSASSARRLTPTGCTCRATPTSFTSPTGPAARSRSSTSRPATWWPPGRSPARPTWAASARTARPCGSRAATPAPSMRSRPPTAT